MNKQPLFILGICFILGIVFQEYFLLPKFGVWFLVILGVFAGFSLLTKSVFLLRFKNFILGFFFFSIGLLFHFLQNERSPILMLDKNETLVFTLVKQLNSNEKNRKYEVLAWRENESEKLKLIAIVPKENEVFDFEHYYKTKLFINPIEKPKNDYQFNYQKYLKRKGIFYQAYLPNAIQKAPKSELNLVEFRQQERLQMLNKIEQSSLSSNTKDLIKGIVLADRTEMNRDLVLDFQKSGLVHILAISGTHIAIIFGVFYWFFNFIFPFRYRKLAIVFSLVFIWTFGVFIGLGNSVFRACIMLSVYFFYVLLERKPDLLHSLSLAAFIILGLDTNQLFDLGFQLSFSAVLGIYWLYQPFKRVFPKSKNQYVNLVYDIISVTMAAQIGTLPLVLYYFHQFSLISVFANLLVIPLLQIIILLSFVMVILITIGFDFFEMNLIFDTFIYHLLKLIHWIANFDGVFIENIPMSFLELMILFGLIFYLRYLFKGFTAKRMMRFGVLFLLFVGVRWGLTIYQQNKNETMMHYLFKGKAVSVKNKKKVIFYIKENTDQKQLLKYIIEPYLVSQRIKDYEIVIVSNNKNKVKIDGQVIEF